MMSLPWPSIYRAPACTVEATAPSGTWRRWHVHISGVGTSTGTVEVYLNGTLIITDTLTGLTWNNSNLIAIELGANINSGPSVATQTRKFSLVQLTTTRPRLVAGEAP